MPVVSAELAEPGGVDGITSVADVNGASVNSAYVNSVPCDTPRGAIAIRRRNVPFAGSGGAADQR